MIKKLFSILILTLLVLTSFMIVAPVPAVKAHSESNPFKTDLIAAQKIDVGNVFVWNDENFLHVKYETTDSWYMSEVHLEVATELSGIPQAKGNPIPGKFTYKKEGLWTTGYEFEIPLNSGDTGTTLYIAAHAKVWNAESLTTDVYESGEGSAQVYGPVYSYLPLNDPGWGTSKSAVVTWKHPLWPLIPDSSAVWISSEYYIEDPTPDSWRKFTVTFNVPGYPAEGSVVTATADNAEEVYHNGKLIGSDGTVNVPFDATYGDPHEWNTIRDYTFTPVQGTNKLEFIVHNYYYPTNDPEVNPTGLIYKVSVSYYTRCETAWGAGQPFPGKNWATYFTYKVQGWNLVETVEVDSRDMDGSDTTNNLETDKIYKFVVTGTYWRNKGGTPNQLCDAEYTTYETDDWDPYHDGCEGYTDGWLASWTWLGKDFGDLQVNGMFVDWGPFNQLHTYEYIFGPGTGSKVNFRIFDGTPNGQEPSWYGDNEGTL
ncbi:MAG: hypothetical protein QXF61_03855, partial [Nitrososphaeria archaeon]